jgi:hypothetical protein
MNWPGFAKWLAHCSDARLQLRRECLTYCSKGAKSVTVSKKYISGLLYTGWQKPGIRCRGEPIRKEFLMMKAPPTRSLHLTLRIRHGDVRACSTGLPEQRLPGLWQVTSTRSAGAHSDHPSSWTEESRETAGIGLPQCSRNSIILIK